MALRNRRTLRRPKPTGRKMLTVQVGTAIPLVEVAAVRKSASVTPADIHAQIANAGAASNEAMTSKV